MAIFTGFLDQWSAGDKSITIRLSVGEYFPDEIDPTIAYVRVNGIDNLPAIQSQLSNIEPYETELYVEQPISNAEITILVEYGEPLVLCGSQVDVQLTSFELQDFQRIAQRHFANISRLTDSVSAGLQKLNRTQLMLSEQARRVSVKRENHEEGTTARKLYDQQLSFIYRVLDVIDR